jgi:hypothetical protein
MAETTRSGRILQATVVALLVGLSAAVFLATRAAPPAAPSTPPSQAPVATPLIATLVGAGDIASCDKTDDEATASLLDDIEGTVMALGDQAYPDGTAQEYAECYDPTWGRHKDRTRPTPGNHEYLTPGAAPYFDYFGEAAGNAGEGWYSYQLGAWHIVVLNANCDAVGGCSASSPQLTWLGADLAADDSQCTLAYWHHSRFTSGRYQDDATFQPFWEALYADGADVVVTAHDHEYERMAPQTPDGQADAERGMTAFVVGTGGESLRDFEGVTVNSVFRSNEAFGVLKLTLRPTDYAWEMITAPNRIVVDSGTGTCH